MTNPTLREFLKDNEDKCIAIRDIYKASYRGRELCSTLREFYNNLIDIYDSDGNELIDNLKKHNDLKDNLFRKGLVPEYYQWEFESIIGNYYFDIRKKIKDFDLSKD
ncbi:hypothetical protein [Taylorella asinigenitalis]|uniref:hypothetical protein n=1 Tax=Taylorella asinigenitalis TaxID=84590 RepID=UPI000490AE90|nr:hypothetical protein [Taylorella asinigenitalis]